jgi:hypothetical protein
METIVHKKVRIEIGPGYGILELRLQRNPKTVVSIRHVTLPNAQVRSSLGVTYYDLREWSVMEAILDAHCALANHYENLYDSSVPP